jgi:hypothetical protein
MSYVDYAYRIHTTDGDFPPDDFSPLLRSDWNQNLAQPWDCKILSGCVRANAASLNGVSYITWLIRRSAVSQLKIIVEGTYSGTFVKLVGLDHLLNNTDYGWLDMGKLYDGYGTPATGRNINGCAVGTAMEGKSGSYICTFGELSSTNATNNNIIVRVKMTGTDIIKAFTIQGMILNPQNLW